MICLRSNQDMRFIMSTVLYGQEVLAHLEQYITSWTDSMSIFVLAQLFNRKSKAFVWSKDVN